MQMYVSESIADVLDWPPNDEDGIKVEIHLSGNVVIGDLLKISYGNENYWKLSIQKEDAINFIFGNDVKKIVLITKDRKKTEKLINPQITISREIGNNYILIIESGRDINEK